MPVTCGHKDKEGYYCIWGSHGSHYHYKKGDKASMSRARAKAEKQGRAARSSGYKGGENIKKEQTYTCECIDCGHTIKTKEHCISIKCSRCGGEMRRLERPGMGRPKLQKMVDENWKNIEQLSSDLGVTIENALPKVKPGEKESTYVSRCIRFETKRSPDRPKDQIQRMCYERYREATGGKKPAGVKSDE